MKTIIFIILYLLSLCGFSQNYMQSVGVRGGVSSGITYRQFRDDNRAIEGIFKLKQDEINLTFLRIFFEPNSFNFSDKMYFCIGYGAHTGYKYRNSYSNIVGNFVYPSKKMAPVLGIDGYMGFEYRVEEIPVLFALDFKPFFEFSTRQIFRMYLPDIAFALKYRF